MSQTAIIDTCDHGHKFAKLDDHPGNSCVHCLRVGLASARAEVERLSEVQREPVEFDYPDFHELGMGCGLEDRNITDRYEAMRYGWDKALDRVAEIIDDLGPLYEAPQTAEQQSAPDVSALVEALEELRDWYTEHTAQIDVERCASHGWNTARHGEAFPYVGEKYLVKIRGILQKETYEFDQGDDGCGGGTYFWHRDDVDEDPEFDPERDEWIPVTDIDAFLKHAEIGAPVSALVEALEFYARGDHLLIGDETEWEAASGEPENWIYHETIHVGVENGEAAGQALSFYRRSRPV